jgi:ubiquinone/menaquinone biosynthesis C-methylase UbiE
MGLIEAFYPEAHYGGFTDVDGTVAFYTRLQALVRSGETMLDIGCGRGQGAESDVPYSAKLRGFKDRGVHVIGIDVVPLAGRNPYLTEFRQINEPTWPVETASIDLAYCDFVLEHIEEPEQFLAEARRVLKRGGIFCFRTPNRNSYVALISRLIPNRFHTVVLKKAQADRKKEDIFPTYYRANTTKTLRRLLQSVGFDAIVVYGYEAEPRYFDFSRIFYRFGVFLQRFAPRSLSTTLFGFTTAA